MMDDLFAEERAARRRTAEPLAARMRPRTLEEVAGQPHLLDEGAAFGSMVRFLKRNPSSNAPLREPANPQSPGEIPKSTPNTAPASAA